MTPSPGYYQMLNVLTCPFKLRSWGSEGLHFQLVFCLGQICPQGKADREGPGDQHQRQLRGRGEHWVDCEWARQFWIYEPHSHNQSHVQGIIYIYINAVELNLHSQPKKRLEVIAKTKMCNLILYKVKLRELVPSNLDLQVLRDYISN